MQIYMLHDIFIFMALFGAGISVLASLGQLIVERKRRQNYNLSVLFLSLGILLVQCTSVITGFSREHPWVLYYHLTLVCLQAPLLYLAYFFLANREEKFPERLVRLFIPAALAFVVDTAFIIAYNEGVAMNLVWGSAAAGSTWLLIKKYLLAAGALQIAVYLLVFLLRMLPVVNIRERNGILNVTILYSLSSLCATAFLAAGYITAKVSYIQATALITSFGIILIYPLGQRYPRFFHILQSEVKERRYKKYLLAGHNVELITDHLTELMKNERLYADETLTLKDLAARLSISPHQLSQLLNDTLSTSFSNYVNRYRINDAERILVEEPDRPIVTIAFEVGFNTKSSFYDAFSRFNGISPHRYRKEKLKK